MLLSVVTFLPAAGAFALLLVPRSADSAGVASQAAGHFRREPNAICVPSGDQTGQPSKAAFFETLTSLDPSASATKTSEFRPMALRSHWKAGPSITFR